MISTDKHHAGQRLDETCYGLDGRGDPVVLIHGIGLDQTLWAAQVAALSPLFKVLRYDLYGHGQSGPGPNQPGLSNFVTQLDTLLTALELHHCAVIGFSLGALVARGFARAFPDKVSRLVIMNGVYQRNRQQREAVQARLKAAELQGPASLIEAALERWFSATYSQLHPWVIAALRERLENNDADGFLNAYRIFADADREISDDLALFKAPALVMTGELDVGSTPHMAQQMAAVLPQATLRIVPNQHHMMPVEAAYEVNKVLLEFLLRRATA